MTTYRERHLAGLYKPDASWTDEATVAELKEALAAKGQPVSGSKAELLDRINSDMDDDDD